MDLSFRPSAWYGTWRGAMARHVFFSFHYKFVWRVNQIRSAPNIIGSAAAGFHDKSLWESSKARPEQIKQMIRNALKGTSVTVVCITYGTKDRTYIDYEIDQSLARGNGLVGIQLHHLSDPHNSESRVGATPALILANGFKVYKYTNGPALSRHIEEAAEISGRA